MSFARTAAQKSRSVNPTSHKPRLTAGMGYEGSRALVKQILSADVD